ncbi:MAG: Rid family hydrolase [Alphaproteobacteria bacterium]
MWVAGTTGFDYAKGTIADEVAEQTHQCFRNIEHALASAGASLADVVRMIVIVSEQKHFAAVAPILGQYFGGIRPAATALVAALVDPRVKVEIEVTAKRRKL